MGEYGKYWIDHKGRKILIHTMSNRWLINIKRKFKGSPIADPIIEEIKRRRNRKK